MQRPPGNGEPGWYPAPDSPRLARFWTGTEWSPETRQILSSKRVPPTLGKFLFRKPVNSDWAFVFYVCFTGVVILSSLRQDYFVSPTKLPLLLMLPQAMVIAFLLYLPMLLFLIPRRIWDKKRGLGSQPDEKFKQ